MSKASIELGQRAEQAAADFLQAKGFRIITTNYRTRLGQIDIIAKDAKTICFVEVKSRASKKFGQPQESISDYKQRKISGVALMFLKRRCLLNSPARFDVVSISYSDKNPKIELIRNAFDLHGCYLY